MAERKYLQGTLDALVLRTLSWGPMHGYGIASWLEQCAGELLRIDEGALYPALYRLERKGWLTSDWRITENNRKAKFYRLTAAGRRRLNRELADWEAYLAAVSPILRAELVPDWART
jgi:PadR family transcriptional regulator, regulatory protein PadR